MISSNWVCIIKPGISWYILRILCKLRKAGLYVRLPPDYCTAVCHIMYITVLHLLYCTVALCAPNSVLYWAAASRGAVGAKLELQGAEGVSRPRAGSFHSYFATSCPSSGRPPCNCDIYIIFILYLYYIYIISVLCLYYMSWKFEDRFVCFLVSQLFTHCFTVVSV